MVWLDNAGCKSQITVDSSCGKECKYLTTGMGSCVMAEETIKCKCGTSATAVENSEMIVVIRANKEGSSSFDSIGACIFKE